MPAPYLTMADIAAIYRVHASTARRWAAEDAWRRTITTPKRYHVGDAQASYDKRHGGRIMKHLTSRSR
jgi:uncharacterized protein YjcR